jgi:hypothetical protein
LSTRTIYLGEFSLDEIVILVDSLIRISHESVRALKGLGDGTGTHSCRRHKSAHFSSDWNDEITESRDEMRGISVSGEENRGGINHSPRGVNDPPIIDRLEVRSWGIGLKVQVPALEQRL